MMHAFFAWQIINLLKYIIIIPQGLFLNLLALIYNYAFRVNLLNRFCAKIATQNTINMMIYKYFLDKIQKAIEVMK